MEGSNLMARDEMKNLGFEDEKEGEKIRSGQAAEAKQ